MKKDWKNYLEENMIYLLGLVVLIIFILLGAIARLGLQKIAAKKKHQKIKDKFVYKDSDFEFNRDRF